tara:strand:- start:617 stop:760 length:144 start_codon:yes stop_codon:yes gene_type:complete
MTKANIARKVSSSLINEPKEKGPHCGGGAEAENNPDGKRMVAFVRKR